MQLRSEDPEENWTVFRSSTVDTLGYISQTPRRVGSDCISSFLIVAYLFTLMRMMKKSGVFLKKISAYTKHTEIIQALYPRRQPTTTSVRQSRADSGTYKIPG